MENTSKAVFESQQKYRIELRKTDAATRIAKLKRLKAALQEAEETIYAALENDLRKSRFESAVTELFFTYGEIDYAIKRLKKWMKPKAVGRSMANLFARNRIYYEPKGVCLIIAPWNYPLQLAISPLVSAIAAGNCVILKPSELSVATAAAIKNLIDDTFDLREVACFEGGAETAKALLELPFDHIFFTGSTAVGKLVMKAASEHLSSVTLELGGKSPVIVDRSANLKAAAERIAWGKLVNAGQTCIAPDYVLIESGLEQTFTALYKAAIEKMFFKDGAINEAAYGKIINKKHFLRLMDLLKEAVTEGAKLVWGGGADEAKQTIYPAVLTQVEAKHRIMQEEIFGPVLPVVSYTDLQEAIDFINAKEKPLALYIFSRDEKNRKKILAETTSGGTCVNDVLIHISNPKLPFGGVNGSGTGSAHGFFGFKSFSHERAVVFQSAFGLTKLIYPPYAAKEGLLKWLKKLM